MIFTHNITIYPGKCGLFHNSLCRKIGFKSRKCNEKCVFKRCNPKVVLQWIQIGKQGCLQDPLTLMRQHTERNRMKDLHELLFSWRKFVKTESRNVDSFTVQRWPQNVPDVSERGRTFYTTFITYSVYFKRIINMKLNL